MEIKLPSGSVTVPLEKLPSGHLAMVIDDYERLQAQQSGVPATPMHLHANLPGHMTDSDIETPKQINACVCGDRDCLECGQQYLARRSTNAD